MQTIVTVFLLVAGGTLAAQFLAYLNYCRQREVPGAQKPGQAPPGLATAK